MSRSRDETLQAVLADRLRELARASRALELSYRRVVSLDTIDALSRSDEGMIEIEALTARFARVVDIPFRCADTEALFRLRRVARFANIERPALRKLKQIDLARRIEDLRAPPANRLDPLAGDRAGQWSVRVNDQFRICFRWTGSDAQDVEIVDYH